MAKSLSTDSNFGQDSSSRDLEKGINVKPPDVFLPPEIISNILSRLPAKSLLRFRCVCKLWRSLFTDDPYFISQHYSASLKRPMLIPALTTRCTGISLHELRPSDDIKHISFPIKINGPRSLEFSNPVRGLVYADGYLLNPFTRDIVQLPKSSRRGFLTFVGLGFDESFTGRCKIVRLFVGDNGVTGQHPLSYACEVLTVGTHEWRYVGDAHRMEPCGHAIFLNGAVHWLVYISYKPLHLGIFSFDIKYEKFQLVSIPITSPYNAYTSFWSIHDLKGHICLVCKDALLTSYLQTLSLRIWILKDYDKNEWEQEYNIDMTNWAKQHHFEILGSRIVEVRDGKILIQNTEKIYSFDLQRKKSCALSFFPNRISYIYHVITESLVSPRNMLKQSINS